MLTYNFLSYPEETNERTKKGGRWKTNASFSPTMFLFVFIFAHKKKHDKRYVEEISVESTG